jgi:AcrR family transcriptional regulator
MASAPEPTRIDGRRKAAAARRRERKAKIIAATRESFDANGMRGMQIEHIATAVGINRAIVYRHFSGKDELISETLVTYLEELHDAMAAARDSLDDPTEQLRAIVTAFVDYGMAHPAFVDCAQELMLRPGDELLDEISEGALFRLGRGITSCLTILSEVLTAGVDRGVFELREEPSLLANAFYASGLGSLQLARLGILVTESAPGIPVVGQVSTEQVRNYLVDSALALVRPRA